MPDPRRTATESGVDSPADGWLSTAWIANQFERSRLPTVLLMLAISAAALSGYLRDSQRPTAQRNQPRPARNTESKQVQALNVGPGDAVLVVELDDLFTPLTARAVRDVVKGVEQLDFVRDVFWLDDIPSLNLFGLAEDIVPPNDASLGHFAVAKARALRHPLVAGQLLSLDGRTLLLPISFDWLLVSSDEACTARLLATAQQAAAAHPEAGLKIQLTGRVPLYLASRQAYQRNEFKFQVIGYTMGAILAAFIFRGVVAVLVVAGAPALGMFWALGFVKWMDDGSNPLTSSVLPVLISMVGLADGVHLMVHIRRERAAGLTPIAAAKSAIEKVGLACGLTSLTTAVGFGSLMLADHTMVQDFGKACALGVCLTFVAVITFIPLACTTILGRYVQRGHDRDLLGRQIARLGDLIDAVLARPWRFSMAGVLSTLLLGAYALQLRPDDRVRDSQPAASEAYRALAHCDRAFGGIEPIHVTIYWNEDISDDDPVILATIRDVQQALAREQLLGKPISINDYLDYFPGTSDAATRFSYLTLLPETLQQAYYRREKRQATITARVQDLGLQHYVPVFDRIETALARLNDESPGFQAVLYGGPIHRGQELYQIVVDLAVSLGTASVIIFFVMTFVYRSLRLGLIALTPNLFPLAVTAAGMAVVGQPLDISSVCAFTVCLGIAVDDTIHFLTRYRQELQQGGTAKSAIHRSFLGVGAALVMTTIVLVAGFGTVLTSDLPGQRIFAAMACSTIAAALLGDLLFLPALLLLFGDHSSRQDRVELMEASEPGIGIESTAVLESMDRGATAVDAFAEPSASSPAPRPYELPHEAEKKLEWEQNQANQTRTPPPA